VFEVHTKNRLPSAENGYSRRMCVCHIPRRYYWELTRHTVVSDSLSHRCLLLGKTCFFHKPALRDSSIFAKPGDLYIVLSAPYPFFCLLTSRFSLSIGVAGGVIAVPFPGGGDDFFEVCPFGLPAEFRSGFGGIADKHGRVARPARRFDDLDFFS